MTTLTVAEALRRAKARGVDRLDAQLLLAHLLACDRSWLLAHDDAALSPAVAAACLAGFERRAAGEPLAYIVGKKEFHGLSLEVSTSVLVPRPETEGLVDWALERLRNAGCATTRVLDLGTGSGAIALAIKSAWPEAVVVAADISDTALIVAAANARRLGLAIDFRHCHWWDGFTGERFHLVVSNPPYIHPEDPHLAALRHEPRGALTPDGDGLGALSAIVAGAATHLEPGGWLLLEHGHDQAAAVQTMLAGHGLSEPQTRPDLAGLPRCSGARLIARPAVV